MERFLKVDPGARPINYIKYVECDFLNDPKQNLLKTSLGLSIGCNPIFGLGWA